MSASPATNLTLVSSGLADARLQPPKGNPRLEQFVNVVQKTTRWAAQWNRVDFDGSPEFGQRASITLPRRGELISGFTLCVTMPDIYTTQLAAIQAAGGTSWENPGTFFGPTYGWTNSLGHALIDRIELEIGGVIVETLDSRLLEILDELYEPLDSAVTKNTMIKRAPSGFGPRTWLTPEPLTVQVPIPFWFSRPGATTHALPLDALKADIVRVHVTFRPIEQLYYTDARVDTRTVGYRAGVDGAAGGMWGLQSGRFWRANPAADTMVYRMKTDMPASGMRGELIPGITMPPRLRMEDAFALVEYISLEEYEALMFRSSELTYHVEQHMIVPVQQTHGLAEVRVPLPYVNPVKELLWAFQRPEAETYNAWFLFSRDLAALKPAADKETNPCCTPWWSDATLTPLAGNRYQIQPAFAGAYSEPLESATLYYGSYERFFQYGGSFFRTVVPAQSYVKSAVHDKYVYAYNFGARPEFGKYGPSGAANWDKIPYKELYMIMARGRNNALPPAMNAYVYVTFWNVFKVFGGRGGMLFSN